MTATMHEPSTAGPARDGIATRLLAPAFWGAVSKVPAGPGCSALAHAARAPRQ